MLADRGSQLDPVAAAAVAVHKEQYQH
jgi:hypothetical protein